MAVLQAMGRLQQHMKALEDDHKRNGMNILLLLLPKDLLPGCIAKASEELQDNNASVFCRLWIRRCWWWEGCGGIILSSGKYVLGICKKFAVDV